MSSRIKFFDKKFLLIMLTILALSLIGAFALNLGMNIDDKGEMSTCILMNSEPRPCQMTLIDHLAQWQQTFLAASNWSLISLFSLVLAFSVGFIALYKKNEEYLFLQLHQRYKRKNPILKLFDYLLLAFSKGIIHQQIYA